MSLIQKIKDNTWFLVILAILVGVFLIYNYKTTSNANKEIDALKTHKTTLELQIAKNDSIIRLKQDSINRQKQEIDSLVILFDESNKLSELLKKKLAEAISNLDNISSDSSYVFLQEIAYKYPGTLKYLFNELQIKGIHATWLKAQGYENIICEMDSQIDNCQLQFKIRDRVYVIQNSIIDNQEISLNNCIKLNNTNDSIIAMSDNLLKKETTRKKNWRLATIISVFGIIVVSL